MLKIILLFLISGLINNIYSNKKKSSIISAGDSALYTDVTLTNLPISSVSGPGMDVGSADFDGDGDIDIIIAREFAPNVLLLNEGNGVFINGTAGRLPQFNYDSEDIGIADFDQDGDSDLVFASEDNAIHEFYLNDGNAVFTNFNNRLPQSITNGLLVLDINNDNYPDLIFGNSGPGNPATAAEARVLINNHDTTFRDETALRFPAGLKMIPQDIKAGDLDKDGDLDIVFGNETGNRILINNGSGVFTDETVTRLPLNGDEETRKVTMGDIDIDGDLDMFFANVAFRSGMNGQDRLLINNGSGFFTDETVTRLPFDSEHTTEGIFLDVDFDNDPDLITSNVFVNRPLKVFLNNGSGIYTENTLSIFPSGIVAEGLGIEAADFNSNGLKDLYIVHRRTAQSLGNDKLLFRKDTSTVGINYESVSLAEKFELYQNFPNPFNPSTIIRYRFTIPNTGINDADVFLIVYDIHGREVTTLVKERQKSGSYNVELDLSDFPSGVYFYKLSIHSVQNPEGFTDTKRMLMIK